MKSKKPPRKLTILNTIGEGHFSEVKAGTDPIHGGVAVKILKKGSAETDQEWKKRKALVLKEGKHLSAATHENIVKVFYTKTANKIPILVMEHCQGGSLLHAYKAGPLPLSEARRILTDATTGLSIIHARNMIHRDIKPANILLDGNTGRAKLGDFGLVTDEFVLGYASQAGYVDHLAKEVFDGEGTSTKTDIWAMGMTAYRLLHGQDWYDQEVGSARYAVQDGGFARKLKWLPHIPDSWRRLIRKAMHDNSSNRFQSAHALLDGLAKIEVTPNWQCKIGGTISWTLTQDNKSYQAEWNWDHQRPQWSAHSIESSSGKKRQLKTSNQLKELQTYLTRRVARGRR